MTREEFETLTTPDARNLIDENIGEDPIKVVMRTGNRAVSTQLRILEKCRKKLPEIYRIRGIVPDISFQQCSSEATAVEKAEGTGGRLCIDLTCGLGIDSMAFTRKFDRVVSIERNEVLCDIVRYNLSMMGVNNMEVVCDNAERFLESYTGQTADLIYMDPARREEGNDNKRVLLVQDCSPDVLSMMDRLRSVGRRIMIKLSPLFDTDEALRIFGDEAMIRVISVDGECKELIVDISDENRGCTERVKISAIRGDKTYRMSFGGCTKEKEYSTINFADMKYLMIPDAAIVKCRVTESYFEKYHPEATVCGYGYSETKPKNFCGRIFGIDEIVPYQPKVLKARLKGIKRINILRNCFPHSPSEICKAIGVTEGGAVNIAFTLIDGKRCAIFLNEIDK